MPFCRDGKRPAAQWISALACANPFLPERIGRERAVLGAAFVEGEPVWSQPVRNPDQPRPKVLRIVKRLEPLLEQLQSKLSEDADASEHDLRLYENAAIYLLYERYHRHLFEAGSGGNAGEKNPARWQGDYSLTGER